MTLLDREPTVGHNGHHQNGHREAASEHHREAPLEGPPSACWLTPAARLAELEVLRARSRKARRPLRRRGNTSGAS